MKKFLSMFMAVLLICIPLAGCTIEVEEEPQEEAAVSYHIYYLSSDATELIEEDYIPKEETTEYMLKDLMQRLGKKAAEGEEINLLPKEVTINSYKQQENVLIIDFNSQYSKMSRAREVLVRAGIVKTFIQVPGIGAVRFTVGGEDLKDSRNAVVGEMTEDTFVEYSDENLDSYRYDTFTLYFTDKTGTGLVEEKRNVYYKRNLPKERVVLEQLAKGPMVKDHYPTIPESAAVLSVMTADRVCYVSMDASLTDYIPEVSEEAVVYSIVNSLLAVGDADKVQISIEGKNTGNFGENLPVYSYYEKNEELIVTE